MTTATTTATEVEAGAQSRDAAPARRFAAVGDDAAMRAWAEELVERPAPRVWSSPVMTVC
jgi:hypothetical protein